MRGDYRKALEVIADLCANPRNIPTRRQERIHDIAMEALGMTSNQRNAEIERVRQVARDRMVDNRKRAIATRQMYGTQEAV